MIERGHETIPNPGDELTVLHGELAARECHPFPPDRKQETAF